MGHDTPGIAPHRTRYVHRVLALAAGLALGASLLVGAPASAATPSADLSVALDIDPAVPQAATPVTLTLTVTNAGPDIAEGVAAAVQLDYQFQPIDLPDECHRSSGESSIVCELGDLPVGTVSLDLEMTPVYSGVFDIGSVVASATPDPDRADNSDSDTVIVVRGPLVGHRYVVGTIPVVLERPADRATIDYWAPITQSAFRDGITEIQKVPLAWLSSNEYRRLRVREAYTRILGRPAGAGDQTFWSDRVRGGMTYARLDQLLIGSAEFAAKHPADAIEAVYLAVLRRPPGPGEAPSSVASLVALASSLQRTTEGYDVVINDRYQRTVGHGPDPLGHYVWLYELRRGTSPERMWSRLLAGIEYLRRYPTNPDDYEEWYGRD